MSWGFGIFFALCAAFIACCLIKCCEKTCDKNDQDQVPKIVIDQPPPYNNVVDNNFERRQIPDNFHCFSSEFKDLPSYNEAVAIEKSQNEEMYHLAAEHGATVIICYVAGKNVRDVKEIPIDEDPIPRMSSFFEREIDRANSCGLTKGFIDPGLGFYYDNLKDSSIRIRYQMKTFLNAFRLRKLGWPVCNALPHAFECFGEEVRSAEPFFSVLASLGKTDLIRTHEVSKVAAILKAMRVY